MAQGLRFAAQPEILPILTVNLYADMDEQIPQMDLSTAEDPLQSSLSAHVSPDSGVDTDTSDGPLSVADGTPDETEHGKDLWMTEGSKSGTTRLTDKSLGEGAGGSGPKLISATQLPGDGGSNGTDGATPGNDNLTGTSGEDVIRALGGNDVVKGLGGNDKLFGQDGKDLLKGGGGDDKLVGGSGRDDLLGGGGDDKLIGGNGKDELFGKRGQDKVIGGKGDDALDGGAANDRLDGGKGDDIVIGGKGADVIEGGIGDDTMLGGSGPDKFLFKGTNTGEDMITDFILGTDILDLTDTDAKELSLSVGANAAGHGVISWGGDSITLEGHSQAEVFASVFDYVDF